MDALAAHGGSEVLYGVATSTDYPGWGYMVSQGATTIWEAWGGVQEGFIGYNSGEDSMPMFASISEYFYEDIAGIRGPDYFGTRTVTPGFREIQLRPRFQGDLTHAEAHIRTVRGMAGIAWERNEDTVSLKAVVPVNARARISVPKGGLRDVIIEESGRPIWEKGNFSGGSPGLTAGSDEADYVTFDTGSGTYLFVLRGGL